MTDLSGKIAELGPGITRVDTLANFYQGRNDFLVSEDHHTTIIPFTMAGDFDDASDTIEEVVEVVDGAKGESDFKVLITAQANGGLGFREVADEGLQNGETFSVPIALLILVLVSGAIVAALISLILAVVSIVAALGIAALVGQVFALSFFVQYLITMIGLAVGIDTPSSSCPATGRSAYTGWQRPKL